MTTTATALKQFLNIYQQQHLARFNRPAQVNYDDNWRSPCEVGAADAKGRISWEVRPQKNTTFSGLEAALEIPLHPSIKAYYGAFWFPTLGATCTLGDLDLIGVWNLDDFDNLQRNIIGHALQQRQRKLPLTVFFALTLSESEYYLAINNQTGNVVLERAGSKPERTVADDAGSFLSTLIPCINP